MENQYPENQEEQEIKLSDYIAIALRYKWLIISIFLIVFASATIYTSKSPRIYRATSMILLEDIISSEFIFSTPSNKNSSINNNIEIVKSIPVLKIAYLILQRDKSYKLFPISNKDKDFNPLGYLKARISVDSKRETDILNIKFDSISRIEAKAAANAVANALKQRNTEYARIEFTNAREFLADQLEEAELRLRSSEEDLRLYKIDNGISILSEETTKLIEQSSDLGAELSSAETELEVVNKHLNYLKGELTKQDSILLDVNSILTSPLIEQLRAEIVANQARYVKLITKPEYSANHPELLSLNQEIESGK
ncbi:MAG: hypothetical protein DRJ01_16850, partial [Bacteroidetes bacterium]